MDEVIPVLLGRISVEELQGQFGGSCTCIIAKNDCSLSKVPGWLYTLNKLTDQKRRGIL